MSLIMYGATVCLALSGLCFSGLYLWLNLFSTLPDVEDRSKKTLRIVRVSAIVSLCFSLLNAIITDKGAAEALVLAVELFTLNAVFLFIVVLASAVAMVYAIASRRTYHRGLVWIIGKLLLTAGITGAVSLLFSWLLG